MPKGVLVIVEKSVPSALGQSEIISEDTQTWYASQAVQYSDTHVEQFQDLVMKNKAFAVKAFFVKWAHTSSDQFAAAQR